MRVTYHLTPLSQGQGPAASVPSSQAGLNPWQKSGKGKVTPSVCLPLVSPGRAQTVGLCFRDL